MLDKRLRELREEKDFSQEEVANKLNIGRSTYASWEIGRSEPSVCILILLADFYNVSLDYLCGKTNIKDRYIEDTKKNKYIKKCLQLYDEFLK